MDVSTIVVSYNTRSLTRACLASVFEKTEGVDFEVIVVDNASADGSAAMIRDLFPRVELIESDSNLGFAAANNLAIGRASSKYIFLLNPDTVLLNNCVKTFYDFMEDSRNQRVGAVGAFLRSRSMEPVHSYCEFIGLKHFGPTADLSKKGTRLVRRLKSVLPYRLGGHPDSSDMPLLRRLRRRSDATPNRECASSAKPRRQKVDYITGADLFIRRSVLQQVGVFDEDFFMYAEEVDLQYRMHRKGHERVIIDGPLIVHIEGGSMEPAVRERLMLSGSLKFLKKHFPLKYGVYQVARLLARPRPGAAVRAGAK